MNDLHEETTSTSGGTFPFRSELNSAQDHLASVDDNGNDDNGNDPSESSTGGGGLTGLLRRKSSGRRDHHSHNGHGVIGGGGHHSRDSSLMDDVLEHLHDMTDAIVEKMEDVQHELVEVLEEPIAVPVKPREEGDHSQKLSAMAVALLVFYKVSGGPFGCEPAVKAAGPFYALLGFTLFPILWCIPEALVTAELGSAFPEPSGCTYDDYYKTDVYIR